MYSYIAKVLFERLSDEEWKHVSAFINQAQELGEANKIDDARKALKNAALIADSYEEYNVASKIEYYLRF